eukprot:gene6310-biopygen6923
MGVRLHMFLLWVFVFSSFSDGVLGAGTNFHRMAVLAGRTDAAADGSGGGAGINGIMIPPPFDVATWVNAPTIDVE